VEEAPGHAYTNFKAPVSATTQAGLDQKRGLVPLCFQMQTGDEEQTSACSGPEPLKLSQEQRREHMAVKPHINYSTSWQDKASSLN